MGRGNGHDGCQTGGMTAAAPVDVVDLRLHLRAVPLARDVVRVAGPDAAAYLQGQASQDVAALDVGSTTWSFVLQPAGKVDAWVRVTRTADDEFVLDTDPGAGEATVARLRRFLLRTKAEVDAVDWPAVALRGPGAEAAARAADVEGKADGAAASGLLVVPIAWPGAEGADLLGPRAAVPEGIEVADAAAYESLRVRSGVPAVGAELTDRTIPAEAGQWVVDASVSFTKGCFTGQELVARIDSRGGNVPRRLRAVVADGGLPGPGAPVEVDGAEVGTLTSVAPRPGGGTVGLAFVSRSVAPPAEATVAGVAATVLDTPLPA